MPVLLVIFFVPLAVIVAVGWAVAQLGPAEGFWASSGPGRACVQARDSLITILRRGPATLGVLLASLGAVVAICWPLGSWVLAKLENSVDVPVFTFFDDRQPCCGGPAAATFSGWHRLNDLLTLAGNRPQVKIVCVLAIVLLTILWRRHGWWIPAVAIVGAFGLEKYTQKLLALAVHRGNPPTTLGTYPSGGCGRLIAIYGVILALLLVTFVRPSRKARVAAWTGLAVLAAIEGYTRYYLLKHWFTDVIGGWVFGTLLLLAFLAALSTLLAHRSVPADEHRPADSEPSAEPISV